jgi:hypothetical protein
MEKVFLGVLAGATEPRVQLAARGVLDFIHYVHFETHCDESLLQLDNVGRHFTTIKVFSSILKFASTSISAKIHKLKHYVDSIRSRGTADGFNTEETERLDIDLAKVGYNASNKGAYTRQMTVWLRGQESVHKFGNYLQWAVPGYIAPSPSDDAVSEEPEAEAGDEPTLTVNADDVSDDSDDSDDEGEVEELPTFSIAKTPAFPALTVASIPADFIAPAFIPNLSRFLQSKSIIPQTIPADNSTFPVYKLFSLFLPVIEEAMSSDTKDTVRAVKGEPVQMTAKGVKPAKAGQFDTVLVRTNPAQVKQGPTDGKAFPLPFNQD